MDVCLEESLGRAEGPTVLLAWQASVERRHDRLVEIDAEMHALRPSSTARQASRAMGRALLKTWQQIHPHVALDAPLARVIDDGHLATLPVAFALACRSASIDVRATIEGFLYSRLAATVSCAMRLMPIGQYEAHGLLASTLARVPAVVDQLIARGEAPAAFAPALDVAVMSQQYVGSRLFLS
jgi:urease accessory protein UreF